MNYYDIVDLKNDRIMAKLSNSELQRITGIESNHVTHYINTGIPKSRKFLIHYHDDELFSQWDMVAGVFRRKERTTLRKGWGT